MLREPLEPRPTDVRSTAASVSGVARAAAAALVVVHFSDLTEYEKEEYHCLILNCQRDLAKYDRKQSAHMYLRI